MYQARNKLVFTIIHSINSIPREDWDRLFGKDQIESYGYQKTLEESGIKEFTFLYAVGTRGNHIKAIFPFYYTNFSFTTIIQGPWQKLIISIQKYFKYFMTMKMLFIGTPTTEEFYLGVAKDEDLHEVLDALIKTIESFCRKRHIHLYLFFDIADNNRLLMRYLARNWFGMMESFPTTLIRINANSLEEFISGLSKNTRKDLKKKLRRSQEQVSLTTEVRQDIGDCCAEIYQLYLNNFEEANVRFEILTPQFFSDIFHNMPGEARLFITRDKQKIVAFNLCLVKDNKCIDKFIGFDSAVSHKYHLYHATFCYNIDWCIKNGITYYQPGVTDYHPKVRLGAKLIPLYIFVKALNPLTNLVVKPVLNLIQPKNFDPHLKKISSREIDQLEG